MEPRFLLNIPLIGNRLSLAICFELHLAIVAMLIGVAMIAPIAEWLGNRGDERWARLARKISSSVIKLYAFGATWAVFALVVIFIFFPRAWATLISVFFPLGLIFSALWVVMTLSSYFYAESWDRLASRPRLHQALGWTFVIATMAFVSFASGMAAFSLTPNQGVSFFSSLANATWAPQMVHRHLGNLSYGGLLIGGFSGWKLLTKQTTDEKETAWLEWLGRVGMIIGMGAALIQPLVGLWYSLQIRAGAPSALQRIMTGNRSGLFLAQQALFGAALFCANMYLALVLRSVKLSASLKRWLSVSLPLAAAFAALGAIPRTIFAGTMLFKYISLGGVVAITVVNLTIFSRVHLHQKRLPALPQMKTSKQAAAALLGTAALAVALLVIMGIIRETAQGPWQIYQRLPANQKLEQQYEVGVSGQ